MFKQILEAPNQLGRLGRFTVFQLKLWRYCTKLLKQNHCGQQAAALSYHTIFGIVPLAIVMLLIFQSLPAWQDTAEKFKTFIYEQTHLEMIEYPPDAENPEQKIKLTEKIDQITANFFAKLDEEKGSLTILSAIIIIWAAIALLTTIERTFNRIWHVHRGRTILQRIVYYWATLTLAPLLLGLGLYISARYGAAEKLGAGLLYYPGAVLPYVVSVSALFLLYLLMPNTKVSGKSAIWAAAVAGLAWMGAKWIFKIYVTVLIPYSRIYGIMGLVPLTVLWIYITWLIVLFGVQLTFTTQHLKTLDAAEMAAARKPQEYYVANELTVINIMRHICLAFQQSGSPVSTEMISSKLDLPDSFVEKMLNVFVAKGLLLRTSEPTEGFVPAGNPENITLDQIANAVTEPGGFQTGQDDASVRRIIRSHQSDLSRYSLKQLL